MSPAKLKIFLSNTPSSVVAFEGASTCHYWGRFCKQLPHDVRIIGPRKVKAFLQGQKTDANDALAIAVAATQPGIIFSQLKNEQQQTLQSLESSRRFLDKQRVSLKHHLRAFLYEWGIACGKGIKYLRERVIDILSNGGDEHILNEIGTVEFPERVGGIRNAEKNLLLFVKLLSSKLKHQAMQIAITEGVVSGFDIQRDFNFGV